MLVLPLLRATRRMSRMLCGRVRGAQLVAESAVSFTGWPHGVESALHGVVDKTIQPALVRPYLTMIVQAHRMSSKISCAGEVCKACGCCRFADPDVACVVRRLLLCCRSCQSRHGLVLTTMRQFLPIQMLQMLAVVATLLQMLSNARWACAYYNGLVRCCCC